MNFEEFDTEPKIDQVYIFSDYGTESTILAIFSGHEIPPEITSWYDHVLIWFVSDEKVNHQGWKLRFKEID